MQIKEMRAAFKAPSISTNEHVNYKVHQSNNCKACTCAAGGWLAYCLNIRTCSIKQAKCTECPQEEAQGLGALLDKMEDNDYIKLDNIEI